MAGEFFGPCGERAKRTLWEERRREKLLPPLLKGIRKKNLEGRRRPFIFGGKQLKKMYRRGFCQRRGMSTGKYQEVSPRWRSFLPSTNHHILTNTLKKKEFKIKQLLLNIHIIYYTII